MDDPRKDGPVPNVDIDKDLPTLELEIRHLKAKVDKVEARVAWLERGVEGWARGRDWRGKDRDDDVTR